MMQPFLPPEWSEQSGIMLTWPHQHSDWAPLLPKIDEVYAKITQCISQFQVVIIACFDNQHIEHINIILEKHNALMGNIRLYIQATNDSWVRDHGPITVLSENQPVLLDFNFNGWGNKYDASLDNLLTLGLHSQGAFNSTTLINLDFVLEGGSIEVDGKGGLLTTTSCLLSKSRNPNINKAKIEAYFHQTLGIDRVYWLHHGHLEGDDTDGHIDNLARFVDANTIAYTSCENVNDKHFTSLNKMKLELTQFLDWQGNAFKLVPLPLPEPKYNAHKQQLPASYANFLITNKVILVPTYNDPADNIALKNIQQCFPDKEIAGIDCTALIQQFGSLHCATMQLPIGVLT